MKNISLLTFILFATTASFSTSAQDKYFVKFTDKDNSTYSIENPSAFLSERAISRRTKQGISITQEDLPVNSTYVQQVQNTGAIVDYNLKWFNGVVVTITNSNQLTSIQNLSFVSTTNKIYQSGVKGSKLTYEKCKAISPEKKVPSTLELNYGNSSNQIKMMNGHILHNAGFLGEGIQIAVIDAGFWDVDSHQALDSLRTRSRILGTKDFINPNSNIYQEDSHGMMVLSTMGGYIAGQLIGTAPRAKYWLIRTENASVEQIYEEYAWAAGAEFADSVGADIINTSLGYSTFDVESQNHPYSELDGSKTPITKAANIAASKGMVVVVSAGNEGNDDWYYISAPADSPNVLTVGAVDKYRNKAAFSSFGPTADGRIKPDVCAMGQAAVVASTTGLTGTNNGTSFSAPIMAGMVACLWQAKPTLTSTEIIQLVKTSSSNASSPNNSIGYGIPDFSTTVGVDSEIIGSDKISIFPNPFNNVIKLHLPEIAEGLAEYSVISIIGKTIVKKEETVFNHYLEINLPTSTPTGNYIIKVTSGSRVYFAKAVKN